MQRAERPRFAVLEIGAVVAALAILLLIMVNRYGPHRDELYFVSAGQRLAWGYPDQPVFTPLLARLATELAPHNLLALRLPSLIAVALLVRLRGRVCAPARRRPGRPGADRQHRGRVGDHRDARSSPQYRHLRHPRLERCAAGGGTRSA